MSLVVSRNPSRDETEEMCVSKDDICRTKYILRESVCVCVSSPWRRDCSVWDRGACVSSSSDRVHTLHAAALLSARHSAAQQDDTLGLQHKRAFTLLCVGFSLEKKKTHLSSPRHF